ncbi:MAG TPA: hypothetical protein VLF89_05525 [Candidatus Saccharimonadales bacterium]|nr:hypothetical protein [Candidatus Saccharimonadales bacterium]
MNTSDISILFDEDLAWDIREEFKELIADGKSPEEATEALVESYKELFSDRYVPDLFWMSLAATQWKYGRLQEQVKIKAIEAIDSGRDLERWEDSLQKKRRKTLEELKVMLLSPQPTAKKIKKQFVSTTKFEAGDVISFKTQSENFVLIRVIGITGVPGKNTSPVVEVLDWYGNDIPSTDEIKKLPIRKRTYSLAKNSDERNIYSLVYVKEKDYPEDKVNLVMKKCPTHYEKLLPHTMAFWNGLDDVLENDLGFGVNLEEQLISEQKKICEKYSAKFTPTDLNSMLGISDNTDGVNIPINGLRHPQEGDSSGWYIWSGKEFFERADFFKPSHAKHLKTNCSMILKFLGLPPGYRFLYTGDYLDIWYDPELLKI